ncbi:MAG: hypothetical protein HZB34_03610 [Nitrospirae bacterium]|nr:hypothetical protein [Nitrospirota bacterium]
MPVLRPLKAIRAKCLDCCCGSAVEVRRCTVTTCALWPYRLGHRPHKAAAVGAQPPMEATGAHVHVGQWLGE